MHSLSLAGLLTCHLLLPESKGFRLTPPSSARSGSPYHRGCGWITPRTAPLHASTEVIDAEFEDVQDDDKKTLFDLSFASDKEMSEVRIPFIDGENYIDTRLAFVTELDGVQYGIGVPYDHAVALVTENIDGSVEYMTPDSDDNLELMGIMANQVKDHLDTRLKLKRTPRVLTIAGPLEELTDDWKDKILPEPSSVEDLLSDEDASVEAFHEFMKAELGEEEYYKTINEDDEGIPDELAGLFGGIGTGADAEAAASALEDLLKSMEGGAEVDMKEAEGIVGKSLQEDAAALKLISYRLPKGKSYSLVKFLKPYVMVARVISSDEGVRFEMIPAADERQLIPKIEASCKAELEQTGLASSSL